MLPTDAAGAAPQPASLSGIYVVLDAAVTTALESLAAAVLGAGVRLVQYRAKGGVDAGTARRLAEMTHAAGGRFIVNDDLETARAIPGAGLHVGQEDLSDLGEAAVRSFARERIVGLSCGTFEEIVRAADLGVAYVGVGPVAATATKADAGDPLGIAGLAELVRASSLPVAGIGGIDEASLDAVRGTGCRMAAVVRAVANAADPAAVARRLVDGWGAD